MSGGRNWTRAVAGDVFGVDRSLCRLSMMSREQFMKNRRCQGKGVKREEIGGEKRQSMRKQGESKSRERLIKDGGE